MHDTNTARCLYSDATQDPADTLVTEPVQQDLSDTQEQPQEDVDGRLQLLRQQVLGSTTPERSAPLSSQGPRSIRPPEERADWMSHTRPDPPGLQMLADRHFDAPADLVSTQQWQKQRKAPELASLRFASQGEVATTPEPSQPESDPLACWDPEASTSDPLAAAPALPEQPAPPAPYVAPEQPAPYAAPEQPAPYAAPVQPAPYVAPEQPAPYVAPEQPAPYVAPVAEVAPQPMPVQPAPYLAPEQPAPYVAPEAQVAPQPMPAQPAPHAAPVAVVAPLHPLAMAPAPPTMFPGADMDVDASLEEDIDLYLYGKKRRWPWIVALVALVVAVGVAALVLTREPPAKPWAGQVEVVSLPEGAQVSMDGKSVGTTPLKIPLSEPGTKHNVTVTMEGHEAWKDQVALSKEQPSVQLLAILD